MAGNDWPLLVPDPPGKDTKLPETLPTIRSTDEGKKTKGWEKKSNEKEEVLETKDDGEEHYLIPPDDKKGNEVFGKWKDFSQEEEGGRSNNHN